MLLVDADLEAPGISWIFTHQLPDPWISFADLVSLIHGTPESQNQAVIDLIADRLTAHQVDSIYVLPAFRSMSKLSSAEIVPQDLVQGNPNPFILTEALVKLGRALKLDAIVMDVRAGLSELSASLILNPHVYRVFVTTLSDQSVAGTCQVLQLLGTQSPSTQDDHPLPTIIFAQVPLHARDQEQAAELQILESADRLLNIDDQQPTHSEGEDQEHLANMDIESIVGKKVPLRLTTSFSSDLQILPNDWGKLKPLLVRSGLAENLKPLISILPDQSEEIITSHPTPSEPLDIRTQREKIKTMADQLIYAEQAQTQEFLLTPGLRRLVSDYSHHIPNLVITGAKGSGKTYTYLQIVLRQNWLRFLQDSRVESSNLDAHISPVLRSINLPRPANEIVGTTLASTIDYLGLRQEDAFSFQDIRDQIRNSLSQDWHEGQWRDHWLDLFAWANGFRPEQRGAGREFPKDLRDQGKSLVLVIDGLEDMFQSFITNEHEKIALRSLLQEVPDWFDQQPTRSVGVIIFVRRDLVIASIQQNQNTNQFLSKYDPYALKWGRNDALRLALWVMKLDPTAHHPMAHHSTDHHSTAHHSTDLDRLDEMSEQELSQELIPLWGKKLGRETSREAKSADFVLAALSDFKGQIQSRDLVRLLSIAAQSSLADTYWHDRILTPTSIRGALQDCSRAKIEEVSQENPPLGEIFDRLQNLPSDQRKVPFTLEEIDLSKDEISILENNGVVLKDQDNYYVPEIFRQGLGFDLNKRGRAKILSLARKAAQSY